MKEPQRTEALSRSNFKFREFTYAADGKESAASEYCRKRMIVILPWCRL